MNSLIFIRNLIELKRTLTKNLSWNNSTSVKNREIDFFIKRRRKQLKKQQANLADITNQIDNIQVEILLKEKKRGSQTGKPRNITLKEIRDLNAKLELLTEKKELITNYLDSLQALLEQYNQYKIALESNADQYKIDRLLTSMIDHIIKVYQQQLLLKQWDIDHLPKNVFKKWFHKFFK